MKVIQLSQAYVQAFKDYCQIHRYAHDESYLYEEDMEAFEPFTGRHPTWLLLDAEDKIIGSLSFLLDPYFVAGNKTRIRIFHCISGQLAHYKMLFDAVEGLDEKIKTIEAFMPEKHRDSHQIFADLGFHDYRTAYVMVRKNQEKTSATFPEGYVLKPLVKGRDESHYATIRNTAFQTLKGSEAPITLAMVKDLISVDYLLKDGAQILWYEDQPVGIVRMEKDEDPEIGAISFVAPIALLPEHQGKGLGTQLLKAGIEIGQNNGLNNSMLCVNAENDQALGLYKKVGYEVNEAISCLQYTL